MDDKGYSRTEKPKYIFHFCAPLNLLNFEYIEPRHLPSIGGYKSWVHTLDGNGVSNLDMDHKATHPTFSNVNGSNPPLIKAE